MPAGGEDRPAPGRLAPAFDTAAIGAARAAARAVWEAESAKERDRLLALPRPADRLAALDDEEVRRALTPEDRAALRRSLAPPIRAGEAGPAEGRRPARADADEPARDREERRRRWEAEQAEERRLADLRPVTAWIGVPAVCALPCALAAHAWGWGPFDIGAVALDAPSLPFGPLAGAAAALLCGTVAAAAAASHARRRAVLGAALAGAALAGVLALGCLRALPVHRVPAGATVAGGSPLGGAVVRLEEAPGQDLLHVLRGAGPTPRGAALELPAGRAASYLRGATP